MSVAPNTPKPTATPAPARAIGIPTAVSADLLALPSRKFDVMIGTLVAGVLVFFAWAALAKLEEVTTGTGRVVPASKLQIVQNLEGGIIREILVREGDVVKKGDLLLNIDPTQAGSSLGETREKIDNFEALIARLTAELDDKPLVFPDDSIKRRPDLVAQQTAQYDSRRRELTSGLVVLDEQQLQRAQEVIETEARIVTLKRAAELAEEELELMRPLEKSKAVSRAEMLAIEAKVNDTAGSLKAAELALPRLRGAAAEAGGRKAEKISSYRNDTLQQLANARTELGVLTESAKGGADRVSRTTMRAPVAGIVKTLHVSTPGQVVQPGRDILEIVPLNDTLLVEAQVKPKDIAFLRPGQDALVKLSAYDFGIYGGLKGKLEQIGADSVTNERGETYYIVRVRTDRNTLAHGGRELTIMPGMVADVDILTGAKTVLAYLMKPLTRMQQTALRER